MMRAWRSTTYKPGMLGWSLGVGMVIGFSPTVGLQMAICVAVALIWNRLHRLKLNLPAMLVGSLVVNPLTMVPTYLLYYQIGCQVMECRIRVSEEHLEAVTSLWDLSGGVALAIFLGSIPFMVVGLPLGVYLGNRVEALLDARRKRRVGERSRSSTVKQASRAEA